MIIRFNLQPWREVARQKQKKNFIAVTVGVFLLTAAFIGLNYYVEQNYIDEQEQTKDYLKNQIAQLQSAKKQVDSIKLLIDEINKQIQAIELLQSQRGTALKIMDYLAKNTPSEVFLNHISFDGAELEIEGVAENDAGVADFMRILQSNELLNTVTLRGGGIQTAKSTARYEVNPNSETKSFNVAASLKAYGGDVDEAR
ncbi:PilN domain-containing protein [Cardiobacteriaceae bacterium TAE3-ERU3]|nr:PilN domain-containing protein [Cardiobacteriaceae bacterium TAE3-ERU3]